MCVIAVCCAACVACVAASVAVLRLCSSMMFCTITICAAMVNGEVTVVSNPVAFLSPGVSGRKDFYHMFLLSIVISMTLIQSIKITDRCTRTYP